MIKRFLLTLSTACFFLPVMAHPDEALEKQTEIDFTNLKIDNS